MAIFRRSRRQVRTGDGFGFGTVTPADSPRRRVRAGNGSGRSDLPTVCRRSRVRQPSRRDDLPTVTGAPADGSGRSDLPTGRQVRHHAADGHGFAVTICRQSPPTVTPTGSATVTPWRSSDGDRRQAQPSRVRSAATVRRGNRSDGHAPTVPADRFGQSPRPIFRRRQVRKPCRRQQETADGFGRSDLPTVTPWRSSDGDRRQAQPWRQSAATVPRPICRNRSPWQPFRRSRANSPRRQVRTIAAPDLPTVKGSPSRSVAAPSDSLPTGATVPTGSPWRSSDGDRRTRRRSRRENKVCL